MKELNNILFSKQTFSEPNYDLIRQELKRLKIQDLTIQIALKKQELEQNINTLKNDLNNSGKYLLEKLIKTQNKLLQSNENTSEKLEEMKQTLKKDLDNPFKSTKRGLWLRKTFRKLTNWTSGSDCSGSAI